MSDKAYYIATLDVYLVKKNLSKKLGSKNRSDQNP